MDIKSNILCLISIFLVSLVLFCQSCASKPVAQSTNPCIALKLPFCKVKSDFATKNGITTKAPTRKSRPTLNSLLLRQPTATTASILKNDNNSFKAEDGTSLLSILGSRPSQEKPKSSGNDNSEENDSCRGLRFCVLKKDVPVEKRRPSTNAAIVPTVKTPEQPEFNADEFSSVDSIPSLIPLIRDGHLEEAAQYIEDGADVNEEDLHGNSLLLIAAQNGRDDIIRDLLLGGANVNQGNNHKNTAIHLAAQNGWDQVIKILLKAKKIKVNYKDLHANTALHLAAQNGQLGVVEQLIDREDIDVDPVNTHKHTPLHLAVQNGHVELSRILAEAGSNLNARDLIGNTPLHTAYHTSHRNIANILIAAGANENKRNKSGLTPIQVGKRR